VDHLRHADWRQAKSAMEYLDICRTQGQNRRATIGSGRALNRSMAVVELGHRSHGIPLVAAGEVCWACVSMDAEECVPAGDAANPCVSCGACCGYYRASFYWSEADEASGGTVPVQLTEKLNDFRRVMRGTSQSDPRCVALLGTIGTSQSAKSKIADVIVAERRFHYSDFCFSQGSVVA